MNDGAVEPVTEDRAGVRSRNSGNNSSNSNWSRARQTMKWAQRYPRRNTLNPRADDCGAGG
jgi:hypothetical protein